MELENEQDIVEQEIATGEAESQNPEQQEEQVMTMERLNELANSDVEEVEAESQGEVEPEAPDYKPNLTYKVKDEEKQFDEVLAGMVTTPEAEEKLRDLYTRAEGLDSYKQKFSKLEEEAGAYYEQAQQLTAGYKALQEFRDKGEFDKLQQALGLNDDQVVQWALARAEYNELPEEQKAAIRQQQEQQQKLMEYEQRVKSYEEQQHEMLVQNDINELKTLVNSEEVRPIAEAMASRGHNFVEQVLAMGQYEYKRTGVEPSIESVVRKIANQHSYLVEKAKEEVGQMQSQQKQTAQRKEVIPSVSGTGQTRASKPKFTSLDELKKYADSL